MTKLLYGCVALAAFALATVAPAGGETPPSPPDPAAKRPAVPRDADGCYLARSKDGGFSVAFPRPYRGMMAAGKEEGDPQQLFVFQSLRRVAFGGRAVYTAQCAHYDGAAPLPQEVFEKATADFEARGYLSYVKERPYHGHPGVEYLVADDRRLSYTVIYHLGSRVCTVAVETPKAAKPSDDERAHFLDSFQIDLP